MAAYMYTKCNFILSSSAAAVIDCINKIVNGGGGVIKLTVPDGKG